MTTGAAPLATRWTLRLPGRRRLELGGLPAVVGIVNVTPDSFSDGGLYASPDDAVAHGRRLLDEGADLLDLGAESTRPAGSAYGEGAADVPAETELARLLPVLERLRGLTDAPISVDTRKAAVARSALQAGADLVNDVSALGDPEMGAVVAEAGCPVVLMHSRGTPANMQRHTDYDDVVEDVRRELAAATDLARAAGIGDDQVIVDPGIGFAKTATQNLELIRRLDALSTLGRPILLGASRKSFIGAITGQPADRRLAGSLAAVAWAAHAGVALVRVHDVAATRRFLDVWGAVAGSASAPGGSAAGARSVLEAAG